jgi:hypothetical protein
MFVVIDKQNMTRKACVTLWPCHYVKKKTYERGSEPKGTSPRTRLTQPFPLIVLFVPTWIFLMTDGLLPPSPSPGPTQSLKGPRLQLIQPVFHKTTTPGVPNFKNCRLFSFCCLCYLYLLPFFLVDFNSILLWREKKIHSKIHPMEFKKMETRRDLAHL